MKTPRFTDDIPDYGDLFPVEAFKDHVKHSLFNDHDGHERMVRGKKMDGRYMNNIYPSEVNSIPSDVTHIMWFNK